MTERLSEEGTLKVEGGTGRSFSGKVGGAGTRPAAGHTVSLPPPREASVAGEGRGADTV